MSSSFSTHDKHDSNGKVKIPWTVLQWLLALAFAAGTVVALTRVETADHAEKTYLRKDVWEEQQKRSDARWGEIKEFMREIRDELKNKEDKKSARRSAE